MKLKMLLMLGIILSINIISAVGTMLNCSNDPSIMACWHFNNDSNVGENDTFVVDQSIYYGSNATVFSALYQPTSSYLNDGSFYFDNSTDYMNIPNAGLLNITSGSLSLSFWIKLYENSSVKHILYTGGGYQVRFESNKILFQLKNNTYSLSLQPTERLPINQWDFYTFKYNTVTTSIYRNSNLLTSSTGISGSLNSTNTFNIGGRSGVSANTINGSLDEFLIFNKSLETFDIKRLYHQYTTNPNIDLFSTYNCSNKPNLRLCYHFNNQSILGESYNTNSFVYDNSGNLVHGLLSNTTYNSTGSYFTDGNLKFNNINTSVIVPFDPLINLTSNFTVSLWVKNNYSFNQDIISRFATGKKSWGLSTSGSLLYFSVSNNGSTINDTVGGSANIMDNNWHNIIFTVTESYVKGYVDGDLDFTMTYSEPFLLFGGDANIIISGREISNNIWNGSIDEVLIFNKSFNNYDIQDLYTIYSNTRCSLNFIEDCLALENDIVNLNGSDFYFTPSTNGIVNFNNNVTINCNNSKLMSNISSTNYAFYISTLSNITIKDCRFYNFTEAIRLSSSENILINNISSYNSNHPIHLINSNNTRINNSYFTNSSSCIYLERGNNNNVTNNIFNDTTTWCVYQVTPGLGSLLVSSNTFKVNGIYLNNVNNNNIQYNTWLNGINQDTYSFFSSNGQNNIMFNNYYYNYTCNTSGCTNRNAFWFQNESNITISNNYVYNVSSARGYGGVFAFIFTSNTSGNFYNNTLIWNDVGVRITGVNNFKIYNNKFNYSTSGRDGYGHAIQAQNYNYSTRDLEIFNNTIYNAGNDCVSIQGGYNISVHNNYCDLVPVSLAGALYPIVNARAIPCGFAFTELYKTWTGDNQEHAYDNRTNRISSYNNKLINIYNNTFSSNVQCFLNLQGTTNVTHDLANFWYVKHQFPEYLVDVDEYFINNSYENVSQNFNDSFITDLLGTGYMNDYLAQFKLHKNWHYYKYENVCLTEACDGFHNLISYQPTFLNLNLFNLTNSLIYYIQNNTIKRTDIINQQLNYTLNPNKELYVYNETSFNTTKSFTNALIFHPNYTALNSSLINGYYNIDIEPTTNITYAIENFQINDNYTYVNSPINVTSTNDNTVYKMWTISNLITNNLTNMKTNLSFYQCNRLSYVLVVPKGQDPYITMNYTCTNNRLFINNVNLSYSVSSDEIYAFYDFTNLAEIYQTFNNPVLSGSYQSYRLVLSYNASAVNIVKGELNYNGTIYNSTMSLSPTLAFFDTSFNVPLVNTDTDYPFFWNISLTNSTGTSYFISEYNNQTVVPDVLALCDYKVYNYTFINFTTINWLNDQNLNSTFKVTFIYNDQNYSYQDLTEDNYTYPFCFIPQDKAYVIDAIVEYDATGYAPNYYYLYQANLTNQTNNINLYLLNSSYATYTKLKVYDESHNNLESVYITIQAYDVGTNSYKTVAMAKTDYLGEDISYLNWYNTFYKFILTRQGQVLYMSNVTKITETPKNFQIRLKNYFQFDKFDNIVYSLTYNNLSKNFVLTYVLPSGEVTSACLRVLKRTFKNDTEICNVCETSQSATLYCNIAAYGNGTYIGLFYATGSLGYIESIVEIIGFSNTIFNLLGEADATIYAFLFSGIVLVMFMITPVLAIVGLILGVLGGMMLGFQPMNYMEFMGIVIIGGIIIWMLKR